MKNVFYFIKKALYFHLPLFFSLSAIALEVDPRKTLKVYGVINCLSKNLIALYLEKEITCGIETLSIIRVSNKEPFYGKIMQKMCTNNYSQIPFVFCEIS